jgi:hypothetical protein
VHRSPPADAGVHAAAAARGADRPRECEHHYRDRDRQSRHGGGGGAGGGGGGRELPRLGKEGGAQGEGGRRGDRAEAADRPAHAAPHGTLRRANRQSHRRRHRLARKHAVRPRSAEGEEDCGVLDEGLGGGAHGRRPDEVAGDRGCVRAYAAPMPRAVLTTSIACAGLIADEFIADWTALELRGNSTFSFLGYRFAVPKAWIGAAYKPVGPMGLLSLLSAMAECGLGPQCLQVLDRVAAMPTAVVSKAKSWKPLYDMARRVSRNRALVTLPTSTRFLGAAIANSFVRDDAPERSVVTAYHENREAWRELKTNGEIFRRWARQAAEVLAPPEHQGTVALAGQASHTRQNAAGMHRSVALLGSLASGTHVPSAYVGGAQQVRTAESVLAHYSDAIRLFGDVSAIDKGAQLKQLQRCGAILSHY